MILILILGKMILADQPPTCRWESLLDKFLYNLLKMVSNYTIAYQCTEYCNQNLFECLEKCNGGVDCNFECEYTAVSCLASCPCFENCRTGCENCNGSFCKCYDFESNADYQGCKASFESIYNTCVLSCTPGNRAWRPIWNFVLVRTIAQMAVHVRIMTVRLKRQPDKHKQRLNQLKSRPYLSWIVGRNVSRRRNQLSQF